MFRKEPDGLVDGPPPGSCPPQRTATVNSPDEASSGPEQKHHFRIELKMLKLNKLHRAYRSGPYFGMVLAKTFGGTIE
jgi:hypothetical protein